MRCLAPWEHMQVQIIPQFSIGDDRVFGMLPGQILKLSIELVVDDGVIFQPANLAFWRAHFDEAFAAFDNFERLAVCHQRRAVGNCSHAVVKIDLTRGHVYEFVLFMMEARAASEKRRRQQQPQRS